MKKLSEKQAWNKLARLWSTAKPVSGIYLFKVVNDGRYYPEDKGWRWVGEGLCSAISMFKVFGYVSPEMKNRLSKRLRRNKPKEVIDMYFWPTNTELGKQARIEFCRRMAKEC